MPDYLIREATLDDAQALLDYLKILADEPNIPLPLVPGCVNLTIEDERGYLTGHIEADNATYLVVEADGQIVGSAHGTPHPSPIMAPMVSHVVEIGLSLLPEWRGKGIGTELMHHLIDWAKQTGTIKRIELEVFAYNEKAIRIYERLGFEHEGRRRKAFFRDGEYLDSLRMALWIGD
jgi:RimJ/RimL family protein N-acetyltransferase